MTENMVRINLEDPDGKVFDTIELSESEMEKINKRCEEENMTLDEFFEFCVASYALELEYRDLLEKYDKALEAEKKIHLESMSILEQLRDNLNKQIELRE